ncbi:MAG: hypothetical protein HY074_06515 [Deltaproteobacteria bacterium]|nr:hypothetical protein [Deltaproteobacteria bacterium]
MKNFNVVMVFGMALTIVGASIAMADPAGKLVAHCTGIDNPIVADIYLASNGSVECKMTKVPGLGSYSSKLKKKEGSKNVLVADIGSTIELTPDGPKSYVAETIMPFHFGKTLHSRCEVDLEEAKAHGVIADRAPEAVKGGEKLAEVPSSKNAEGKPASAGSEKAPESKLSAN